MFAAVRLCVACLLEQPRGLHARLECLLCCTSTARRSRDTSRVLPLLPKALVDPHAAHLFLLTPSQPCLPSPPKKLQPNKSKKHRHLAHHACFAPTFGGTPVLSSNWPLAIELTLVTLATRRKEEEGATMAVLIQSPTMDTMKLVTASPYSVRPETNSCGIDHHSTTCANQHGGHTEQACGAQQSKLRARCGSSTAQRTFETGLDTVRSPNPS